MGLFSSITNAIGSVLGGGNGGGGGLISQGVDYYLNRSSAKRVQERQEKYTERQMKNAHQWEVQDLQNAGLNPVLSTNSAHAIGGAGTTAETGQGTDLASAISSFASAKNANSASNLNDATTTETKIRAGTIEPTAKKQIQKMDSEIELNKKQEELWESEKDLKKAETKYTNERARGYSETTSDSTSETKGGGWEGGIGPVKGGKNKTHSKTSAKSYSKTW